MRKALLVILCLFLPLSAASTEQPLGVEEFTSMDSIASAILAYFPKAQGTVKSVKGDRVKLDLGKRNGLIPGMALTLWREGKELTHPVTGMVIGREEQKVGTVEVTSVEETSSMAVIRKKEVDPRAGDTARITPRNIRLAVIPVRTDQPELLQALTERLNESGRFEILDAEKRDGFLSTRKLKDSELVREMGIAFDLDAAVSIGIYPSDGRQLVTIKIFYAEDGRLLDTVVARLNLEEKKNVLGKVGPFFAPTKVEAASSHDIPFVATLFASADLDGDGIEEHVFSDSSLLHVYREEISGWRDLWTEQASDRNRDVRHLALDVADINGNGRPEIFAAALRDGTVVTFVLEAQEGEYRVLAELSGPFRVISYPGKGRLLIGRGHSSGPSGRGVLKRYTWSGTAYTPAEDLPVPKEVGMYDFVFADFGEAAPFLIALDAQDRLIVHSGSSWVWRSAEQYPAAGKAASLPGGEGKMRIGRRIVAADIAGDGRDEIILARNRDKTYLKGYTKAELSVLAWTGGRFEKARDAQDIPGAVLDLLVVRNESGASQMKALVKQPGGLFRKDAARVLTFSGK